MASFDYPPLTPDPAPAPLSPTIPLNPPMVGEASPFVHVDGENRDLILESIRAWIRHNLLAWTKAWQDYDVYWLDLVSTWLNTFVTEADAYITEHAISGASFRTTATDIAGAGTTDVVLAGVDVDLRPVIVGDLVLDQSADGNYGIVTVVIDATHATVAFVGSLRGPQGIQGVAGLSIRSTATDIAGTGTTDVVLTGVDTDRPVIVGDLVLDQSADGNYGVVTVVIDSTHATVGFLGSLRGPQGIPGVVQAIVPGDGVMVDNTDPANPVVSATGGGGSTVYATQTLLYAATTTTGNTYTVANAPGLTWTKIAAGVWAVEGVLQVDTSDDIVDLFDTDFYSTYFDGSGRTLNVFHRYSGITYRWTDANNAPGLPWDSDWIFSPPVSNIPEIGAGTISGMIKFTAGIVNYRGQITLGSATDLGAPLELQLPPGLFADFTGDMPVQPTKIGDCWLSDGTSHWSGIVAASSSGIDAAGYFLFIPDLAGSTNFGSDIWAGDAAATVNHPWATGAVLEWELSLPLDSFGTTYDDGRNVPGGEFPVGGGALGSPTGSTGRGLIYPSQNEPTETQTNPLPSQVGVTGWDFVFGAPIPPGIDTLGGSGIQGVGASFSASGIQGGYVGEYTPVMDQAVSFTGLAGAGISGLTDDTIYYVNSITGGYFTVSDTVGGATVPFTGTGTCDTFTLHDLPAGTVVHKNSQYEYVLALPVLASGYTLFNVQQQQYWNWLLYAF